MAKILVVDDDADLRREIEEALTEKRYSVATACDGEEGLKKIEKEKPDLIVLDVMMPKMNGFEVCAVLKNDDRFKTIPVIFLSSMDKEDDFRAGEETGADAYIVKPFEPIALCGKIELLLHQKRNLGDDPD